ncbi:hypothetical protein OG625_19985 [Streptomyces sp. NBC_01351]|uniref:hypothetical protein n=1 Tax=Streptomyces sp. NBC_01351 TaxID=2903833 RepID=UPI002E315545|nr:hypothetical protein [Streptomyces sp. NBC_01351]
MRPTPQRAAGVLVLAVALTGCADVEGLTDNGDLGTAHAPQTLWKEFRPDPPGPGQQPGTAAAVPGLPKVAGLSMRGVNALSVVRADVNASITQDGGTGRLVDPRAVQRLALCTQAVDGGPDCPVRPPVLHDLTGDGREELITALDLDGRLSELRVYTVQDDGRVSRILSRRAVLEGVEVAAEHLAVREPTSNPEYVAVSDYVWDPGTGTMNLSQLTLDTCPGISDDALAGGSGVRCAP